MIKFNRIKEFNLVTEINRIEAGCVFLGEAVDERGEIITKSFIDNYESPYSFVYKYKNDSFLLNGITTTRVNLLSSVKDLIKTNENQKWKQNYFEGIPSPIGAILILLPLIYELSDFYQVKDIRSFSPFLTIFISILLISKIPTYSFKRISINPKLTIFIFLGIGIAFVSLIFFTFESLFMFGLIYFFSLPLSFYTYKKNNDKIKDVNQEEDHEDIL